MPYYGHRCGVVPQRLREAWWVCTACLPNLVPACGICEAAAPIIDRQPGFVGHAYGRLCPACVARVQAAGPWRERRASAVVARRDALLARYPELVVVKATRAVIQLEGAIDGRQVQVRLRTSSRQWTSDRYIFHVEHPGGAVLAADALGLPAALVGLISHGSPTTTNTGVRWLRVAFAHLGKLDVVTVLTALLERTRAPDPEVPDL